jgi:hypothetical protein
VRTRPVPSEQDDLPDKNGARKSDRKLWVEGSVERLDGKICVQARALFVVPKGVKLNPIVENW